MHSTTVVFGSSLTIYVQKTSTDALSLSRQWSHTWLCFTLIAVMSDYRNLLAYQGKTNETWSEIGKRGIVYSLILSNRGVSIFVVNNIMIFGRIFINSFCWKKYFNDRQKTSWRVVFVFWQYKLENPIRPLILTCNEDTIWCHVTYLYQ
jgi:hypothetical protein